MSWWVGLSRSGLSAKHCCLCQWFVFVYLCICIFVFLLVCILCICIVCIYVVYVRLIPEWSSAKHWRSCQWLTASSPHRLLLMHSSFLQPPKSPFSFFFTTCTSCTPSPAPPAQSPLVHLSPPPFPSSPSSPCPLDMHLPHLHLSDSTVTAKVSPFFSPALHRLTLSCVLRSAPADAVSQWHQKQYRKHLHTFFWQRSQLNGPRLLYDYISWNKFRKTRKSSQILLGRGKIGTSLGIAGGHWGSQGMWSSSMIRCRLDLGQI